ncbi:MAG TPA: TraR/DksA C4-type zinc finger protein [Blastocatellia bacterium]|nr:TraR/DksA C4-type zinc finger protein [Blastocatellia bacterium]
MNHNNETAEHNKYERRYGRVRSGNKLADQRRHVIAALATLERGQMDEGLDEYRQDEEIAASDAMEEAEHRYYESLVSRLHQIEEAFGKLDSGAYGSCARCDRKIGKKRLEADPAALLCFECQAEIEAGLPQLQPSM